VEKQLVVTGDAPRLGKEENTAEDWKMKAEVCFVQGDGLDDTKNAIEDTEEMNNEYIGGTMDEGSNVEVQASIEGGRAEHYSQEGNARRQAEPGQAEQSELRCRDASASSFSITYSNRQSSTKTEAVAR
jgi:hypothetical protein